MKKPKPINSKKSIKMAKTAKPAELTKPAVKTKPTVKLSLSDDPGSENLKPDLEPEHTTMKKSKPISNKKTTKSWAAKRANHAVDLSNNLNSDNLDLESECTMKKKTGPINSKKRPSLPSRPDLLRRPNPPRRHRNLLSLSLFSMLCSSSLSIPMNTAFMYLHNF